LKNATTLGILRRAVQGEARAWARRQPRKRDRTCPTFLAKMSRRPGQVIRLLTRPVRSGAVLVRETEENIRVDTGSGQPLDSRTLSARLAGGGGTRVG